MTVLFMSLTIDGEGVATIRCNRGPHGVVSYDVRFLETGTQTRSFSGGLTYNAACMRLYDALSGRVAVGSRICALIGTLRYKRPQDLRLQIMRSMILTRDMCTDASPSRDELGDPALDAVVNDVGDGDGDDPDWIEDDDDVAFERMQTAIRVPG
jgi:hypothetical protein